MQCCIFYTGVYFLMKENALEIGKLVLERSGEIAALLIKTGTECGAKLADTGAKAVAGGAELLKKGFHSRRMEELRPVLRVVMCVSAAVAVVSGVLYFFSRKKE